MTHKFQQTFVLQCLRSKALDGLNSPAVFINYYFAEQICISSPSDRGYHHMKTVYASLYLLS